ncbi:Crp/Fnr family transcriptional regulator [Paraburkholderia caribensis]|uniref:Crp/Fnr family transcriptional regulator n=1 Tax=Paraburkholderia caribensis TaxID=75105 RepID=UPI001F472F27|nr:Crp/Fnr family transcriptional regulator [Paraburkholderia caribensis]
MRDEVSANPGAERDPYTERPKLGELFATLAWFRALAPDHQNLVLTTSRAEYFEPGALVARCNAPSEHWIGVHSGLVKLAIHGATGRSVTLSGVPPGGWFGEGSVIKRELRKYDVSTLQRSLVLLVSADTFHALLAGSLPFNGFVINQLNNRMGEFIATIQNSRLLDINARVARALAQMLNPDLYPNSSLSLTISQQELGLLAGISRQKVNNALQQLEQLKLVRISYNQIDVLDLERLGSYGLEQL